MTTTTRTRTTTSTSSDKAVRENIAGLAVLRRDLNTAQIELARIQADLLTVKREVVERLLSINDGVLPGKTDADKGRVVETALATDASFVALTENLATQKAVVSTLAVEVEIGQDYFQLARLEIREKLADALSRSAITDL